MLAEAIEASKQAYEVEQRRQAGAVPERRDPQPSAPQQPGFESATSSIMLAPPPPNSGQDPLEVRGVEGVKGLDNEAEKHHCFINVCLQALMHLTACRTALSEAAHQCGKRDGAPGCLVCEVRYILLQSSRSGRHYLSPELVRSLLSRISPGGVREGRMADAVETFNLMVNELQRSVRSRSPDDSLLQVFLSDPTESNLINVSDFLSAVREAGGAPRDFHQVLQAGLSLSVTLPYVPDVLVFQAVWNSIKYQQGRGDLKQDVQDFTANLGMELELGRVYPQMQESRLRGRLRGMFTYYPGLHYTCFFFVDEIQEWVQFDDKHVRRRGSWEEVVDWMVRGGLQATLLFYEVAKTQDYFAPGGGAEPAGAGAPADGAAPPPAAAADSPAAPADGPAATAEAAAEQGVVCHGAPPADDDAVCYTMEDSYCLLHTVTPPPKAPAAVTRARTRHSNTAAADE